MEILRAILARQFEATAEMLKQAIERCPDSAWTDASTPIAFWHMAYHAVFYLDLYIGKGEADFTPANFHQPKTNFLSNHPTRSEPFVPSCPPYSKDQVLTYLAHVRKRVKGIIRNLSEADLTAPSPVPWYSISRGDFLLNNLRHVQHHVAQLNSRLRKCDVEPGGWIGAFEQP